MPATPDQCATVTAPASGAVRQVDLADLQSLVVFRRPAPYWGSLILLRLDTPAAGRHALARILPHIMTAADWAEGQRDLAVAVAFTHHGLAALGAPEAALASFPEQLRAGMAARAHRLGDTGESAPAHWDAPFGSGQVHAV
ncbi:MAG: hypothetical protein KC442_08620, partial [Thermomicrobiales bacterium]|nr:hypothetical protein [Thermomicrobiales bacterium]